MVSAASHARVRDLLAKSIRILIATLEARDPASATHSRRVAEISVSVARLMDMPTPLISRLRLAAALHDVGLIAIRDNVLTKPNALTPDEYSHYITHVNAGHKILEHLFPGSDILNAVLSHHERFDGEGFPSGIRGHSIPLGARIIALADAVDNMTNARAWRPVLSAAQMVGMVKAGAGTQFDPEVVTAFWVTDQGRRLLLTARSSATLAPAPLPQPTARGAAVAVRASAPCAGDRAEARGKLAVSMGAAETGDAGGDVVAVPHAMPGKPMIARQVLLAALREAQDIKALPFVTAEVLQLTSNNDSDMNVLTQTILRDPALVANLLKVANTSYYASKGRIQTVERAVVNIGYSGIREIAMGVAIVNLFDKKSETGAVDRVALWRHQIGCAALSRAFARVGGVVPPEDAFVGGLLHDIGIAILDDVFPEQYRVVTAFVRQGRATLVEAEKAFIGMDHTSVADVMAETWRIGKRFRQPMARHHDPWNKISALPRDDSLLIALVKMSATLARALGAGSDCDFTIEEVPLAILRKLNLDRNKVNEVLDRFPQDTMELEAILLLHNMPEDQFCRGRQPLATLQNRNVLFFDPGERPVDMVRIYLESRGARTVVAADARAAKSVTDVDAVVIRAGEASAAACALRHLATQPVTDESRPVYAVLVGDIPPDSALQSLWPPEMITVMDEPASLAAIDAAFDGFFALDCSGRSAGR